MKIFKNIVLQIQYSRLLSQKITSAHEEESFLLTDNEGICVPSGGGLSLAYQLGAMSPKTLLQSINIAIELIEHAAGNLQQNTAEAIILHKIAIEIPFTYTSATQVFCNGFQSWTETGEFGGQMRIRPPRKIAKQWIGAFGDYSLHTTSGKSGIWHGWNFGYIRQQPNTPFITFIGSANEQNGYTLLVFDYKKGVIRAEKSCAGLHLFPKSSSMSPSSWQAIDLLVGFAAEADIFEEYAQHWQQSRPAAHCPAIAPQTTGTPLAGWTSWYYHYTAISEKIVRDNLRAFAKHQIPLQIFQIDDGWQNFVGDWMVCSPKFGGKKAKSAMAANNNSEPQNGLRALVSDIKAQGYKAGLWLAPFICQHQSALFKQHPNWLLRNAKGELVRAGYNVLWQSSMYVLDFYNEEVRRYLQQVFDLILRQWGFDMVKLDFLYAVSLCPPPHKTQGQVLHEAMAFLRETVGQQKQILGCGVPLSGAMGSFDYCRIGPDVHSGWEMGLLKWLGSRERVSTILALKNTLARYWFNGRFFGNDPDVSILRRHKTSLNETQRFTLFFINQLLGCVQFISDNIEEYDPPTLALYLSQFPLLPKQNLRVVAHTYAEYYEIGFCIGSLRYVALCNLSEKPQHVAVLDTLPAKEDVGLLFDCRLRAYNMVPATSIALIPYETRYWVLTKTAADRHAVLHSKHLFLGQPQIGGNKQD